MMAKDIETSDGDTLDPIDPEWEPMGDVVMIGD
jgi:hypothetical protein